MASMGIGEFVEQLAARALPQAFARRCWAQQVATDVLEPLAREGAHRYMKMMVLPAKKNS